MNKKNNGYIAIEAVIVSALMLSVGFFAMMSFTDAGTKAKEKLSSVLSLLGPGPSPVIIDSVEFDSNGYAAVLNVNLADVNLLEEFEFQDLGTSYKIVNYLKESDSDVIIPKYYSDGKPITVIGPNAFLNKGLTSVAIPNSITTILDSAFTYNELIGIIIPDSVEYIEAGALMANGSLESVIMSKNLLVIEENTFYQSGLTTISIPDGVMSIGESAFQMNKLTSVAIPNSVKIINRAAFSDNFQLATISLSNELTFIGVNAFTNSSVSTLVIPETVTEIGFYAFGNTPLTSVEFKGNAPTIIDPNMEYDGVEEIPGIIEHGVFGLCSGLETHSIKVPTGQLSNYQALAANFGVDTDAFYE